MKEVQLNAAPRNRPKLDPRLATLVGLGVEAFAPGGLGSLELSTLRDHSDLRRAGPLVFLRGGRFVHGASEVLPGLAVAAASIPARYEIPESVPVFVRVTAPAALDRLAASGIRLISRARSIATADVGLEQIAELEQDGEVIAIEWTGAFRPLGEGTAAPVPESRAACAAIGLDPERFGKLDGRGCVVGVVDVEGIDLYHPCFVTAHGRTRLLSLWDQRAVPGPGPFERDAERGPGRLGMVHRRDAIGLEISPHQLIRRDVVDHQAIKGSHGTLISALAVGLGGDRPEARGTAPGADLVFVSTFGSGPGALGAMTELADAIAFVVAEADAVGKPCVVNVSLGDDLGPRDGTSPVEQFIDELLETDGRAIVIAAGNAQGKKRHATATIGSGESASFALIVAPRNTERAVVEIWYDAGEKAETTLALEIEAPGDGGRSPVIEADGIPRAFDAGATRVLAISMPRYPGPTRPRRTSGVIRMELLPHEVAGELLAGTWRFHVRAQGRGGAVHAWVDHRYAHWENASDTLTLTTPATARKAIVVGAYDAASDGAAWFSGRGEDRGGVQRPDVLAPGGPLVGAWAESPVRYIATANGTSVAAPLVSGVAALIFQQAGAKLSAQQAREKLLALTKPTASGQRRLWVSSLPARPEAAGLAGPEQMPSTGPGKPEKPSRAWLPSVRPGDAAQVIQGRYILSARGEQVGEILVLPGDRPGTSVEHWALGPRYQAPSAEHRSVSLEFQYVGKPIEVERFLAGLAPDTKCIRASCASGSFARGRAAATEKTIPSAMEGASTPPTPTGSNEMTTKNYTRPSDRTQIYEGTYEIFQDETLCGTLLVTDDAPGESTEHWLLYSGYTWPSEVNTTQALTFVYQGVAVGLTTFLSNVPSGTTYVIANCQQQTLP